jgi:hypothetical protein
VAKEKHKGHLKYHLCSRSAYRRQELGTGVAMEHGKQPCYANRNDANKELVRSKVEMSKVVTDEVVVVMTAMETWKERRASHNRF